VCASAGSGRDHWCRESGLLPTDIPCQSNQERAHQVTAAALSTLQRRAYDHYLELSDERDEELEFDDWCQQRAKTCPQFDYWATVLQVELTVLVYVRSLRQGSFQMYLDALTELATWFHAMDHTNYARWIPVHLRDMVTLPTAHPEVAREFEAGNFTIQKTSQQFSAIPIDQVQCCNQRRRRCCRPHRQAHCPAAMDDGRTRDCQAHGRVPG